MERITVNVAALARTADGWSALLERQRDDTKWQLPGAPEQPAESPATTACRAILWSAGATLSPSELVALGWYGASPEDDHDHQASVYVCLLPTPLQLPADPPGAQLAWWPLTRVQERSDEIRAAHRLALTDLLRCGPAPDQVEPVVRDADARLSSQIDKLATSVPMDSGIEVDPVLLDTRSWTLDEQAGAFLVGTMGEFALSMGRLRRVDKTTARLGMLRVHQRWRSRGLGRQMLAALEGRARDLGYLRLELASTVITGRGKQLYELAGYHRAEDAPSTRASMNYGKTLR